MKFFLQKRLLQSGHRNQSVFWMLQSVSLTDGQIETNLYVKPTDIHQ